MKSTNPKNEYQFSDFPLAEGASGIVYKAIRISDNQVICIKQSHPIQDPTELILCQTEFDVLRSMDHPNIIRCFDSFLFANRYFLVLEFAEFGDLLKQVGKIQDEQDLLYISFQLIEGLRYLHERNVIHRDIKPQNILIFGNRRVKIADLGYFKPIQSSIIMRSRMAGTPVFMEPEMANENESKIGKPSDIWSLGVCLYYLIEGTLPFNGTNQTQIFNSILYNPPIPFHTPISPTFQTLILSMFHKDQFLRSTIEQLYSHPLFEHYRQQFNNRFPIRTSEMHPNSFTPQQSTTPNSFIP
jgi:serine/threonine protein kinase